MADGSGIVLTTRHNPMAWMLNFTKLTVAVDGNPQKMSWGTVTIPAAPGRHRLDISFGYLGQQRGAASTEVDVPPEGAVAVTYRMPSWMFAAGRITVES